MIHLNFDLHSSTSLQIPNHQSLMVSIYWTRRASLLAQTYIHFPYNIDITIGQLNLALTFNYASQVLAVHSLRLYGNRRGNSNVRGNCTTATRMHTHTQRRINMRYAFDRSSIGIRDARDVKHISIDYPSAHANDCPLSTDEQEKKTRKTNVMQIFDPRAHDNQFSMLLRGSKMNYLERWSL